ncbi:hypothetical protein D3C72_2409710 [compost metagenome]
MLSKLSAISFALNVSVPLKNICSRKCDTPFNEGDSSREPVAIHIPMAAERTVDISSVTIVTPFLQVNRFINVIISPYFLFRLVVI